MTSGRAAGAEGAAPPQRHLYTRRRFVGLGAAGAATLALGACAGEGGTTAAGAAPGSETRTIQHGKGELVIPANPQRLVTCEGTLNLLALGVMPIGARNIEGDTRAFPERAEELGKIFDLGGQELDLEQVLALTPDVIIATTPNYDDRYEQLSMIAPTVMYPDGAVDRKHRWDEELEYFATVLGKQQQATDLLAAYRARCADFTSQLGERLASTRISVLRVGRDNLKIYTRGSFSGGILQDAGLLRPPTQDLDAFQTEALTNGAETEGFDISPERLREADGDVIFVCVPVSQAPENDTDRDRATRANAQAVNDHPLWNQLAAVQNGQAFQVGGHWNGETIIDAEKMLDDLFQYLLPTAPAAGS